MWRKAAPHTLASSTHTPSSFTWWGYVGVVSELCTLSLMLLQCLVLPEAQTLDDHLLAHPSPHRRKNFLYKELLSNSVTFSSKAFCSGPPVVRSFYSILLSRTLLSLKLFSSSLLPISLIHFCSPNFYRGLCSEAVAV